MKAIGKKYPTAADLKEYFFPDEIEAMESLKGRNSCKVFVDVHGNGYMVSPKRVGQGFNCEYKLQFVRMEKTDNGMWKFCS